MQCFRECVSIVEKYCSVFEDDFLDHDMEEYRFYINKIYKLWPAARVAPELPASGFEKDLFERVIWNCYVRGELFTYGPAGVIRKLGPGFVPMRYTKRKRDAVRDICGPS
jgi:hypothetical protein